MEIIHQPVAKTNHKTLKQKGFSLLELLLVFAIIAVMALLITRYFIVATRASQIDMTVKQIQSIQAGISSWKGMKSDYTDVSVTALINSGYLSPGDIKGEAIVTPWTGTSVTITTAGTPVGAQYSITYTAIPSWACQNLGGKFTGSDLTPDTSGCGTSATGNLILTGPNTI